MSSKNILDDIQPGHYPASVLVTESDGIRVEFLLQSYQCGMYCAIYVNDSGPQQTGDHDNRRFLRGLKRDLAKAIERGATVELGLMRVLAN